MLSNLPPGVSNFDIEEQAGAFEPVTPQRHHNLVASGMGELLAPLIISQERFEAASGADRFGDFIDAHGGRMVSVRHGVPTVYTFRGRWALAILVAEHGYDVRDIDGDDEGDIYEAQRAPVRMTEEVL